MSHEEVLALLSARAREGSISAAIALERALRAWERDQDELDETIHRILTKDGD